MRKELAAIAAVAVLSAIPAFAVNAERKDIGIIETIRISIEENKKLLEEYIITNLNDIEAIQDLKELSKTVDELQDANKELNDFLSSSKGLFDVDSASNKAADTLLADLVSTIEGSDAISNGQLDGTTLSGQSGNLVKISQDKNPLIAVSSAVRRASEVNKIRLEKLIGDETGTNISGTTGTGLSSLISSTRTGSSTVTYTANGTTYISYGDSGSVIKKTGTGQSIISRSQANQEMLSAGILTTERGSPNLTDAADTTEASIAIAAAKARLNTVFPGQTTELIGAIGAVAGQTRLPYAVQESITIAGADAMKTTMAGAGAEIQEKYVNEESSSTTDAITDEINKEIKMQAEELQIEDDDGAVTQAARALGVIVRQQAAMIGMTKQLALQQMDVIDLTGLTLNAASMKMWNDMRANLYERARNYESLPNSYFQEREKRQ